MAARTRNPSASSQATGFASVLGDIQAGRVLPVYLVYGVESYLRDRFLWALKEAWLDGPVSAYNLTQGDAKMTQAQAVDAASQLSLMPGRRLVIVDEPAFVPCGSTQSRGGDEGEPDDVGTGDGASDEATADADGEAMATDEGAAISDASDVGAADSGTTSATSAKQAQAGGDLALLTYMSKPASDACIVLLIRKGKPDRRKKLVSEIAKGGGLVEAALLKPQERIPYLSEELLKLHLTCPPTLLDRISRLPGEMALCLRELEKLATYAGEGAALTADILDSVMITSIESDVFRLVDALGQRRQAQALRELRALLDNGESPFAIFAMMLRQFRAIFRAKACLADGLNNQQIAQTLKLHPYTAQKAAAQSRSFTYPALEQAMALFLEADLAMKSSRAGDHGNILTDLVISL